MSCQRLLVTNCSRFRTLGLAMDICYLEVRLHYQLKYGRSDESLTRSVLRQGLHCGVVEIVVALRILYEGKLSALRFYATAKPHMNLDKIQVSSSQQHRLNPRKRAKSRGRLSLKRPWTLSDIDSIRRIRWIIEIPCSKLVSYNPSNSGGVKIEQVTVSGRTTSR
jgi:hypothetical protein